MKQIYTVTEIAEMMEITPFGVRRYIYDGRLKAEKIENQYFIKRDDLIAFFKDRGILEKDAVL